MTLGAKWQAMKGRGKRLLLPLTLFAVASSAGAQARVTVQIGDRPGPAIAPDFAGLSFESSNLIPDAQGNHLFSADTRQFVQLFRAIGIRNLRVGGGTADFSRLPMPTQADIDALFAFAKAADVRVIYTLRMLNGNVEDDRKAAKYILDHYASQLECLQIGNEPDWHSFHTSPGHMRDERIVETVPELPGSAYPSYLQTWRTFAEAVVRSAPTARFTGPDTGSDYPVPGTKNTDFDGQSWTQRFAADEKATGRLPFVTQHDYPGQSAQGVAVDTALESMLSAAWPKQRYQVLFDHVLAPVEAAGMTYRMTEANDYTGGVDGASNAFASALWALDYLHWHAAHGAAGVNFHNKSWIITDTIFRSPDGNFHFNPKAYAFEAFDAGSQGRVLPVTLTSAANVNVTAYAVRGPQAMYVTLINKEHGPAAQSATVTLKAAGLHGDIDAMRLVAPGSDVRARDGITFGGASISPDGWQGHWTREGSARRGSATVALPPASAVVVKLAMQ